MICANHTFLFLPFWRKKYIAIVSLVNFAVKMSADEPVDYEEEPADEVQEQDQKATKK